MEAINGIQVYLNVISSMAENLLPCANVPKPLVLDPIPVKVLFNCVYCYRMVAKVYKAMYTYTDPSCRIHVYTVPEFSVRAGGNSNIDTVLEGQLHTVHINSGKLSREKNLNYFLIGITTKRS